MHCPVGEIDHHTRAPSRQNLPQLRHEGEMLSGKGAYRLRAAGAERKVVLIATLVAM